MLLRIAISGDWLRLVVQKEGSACHAPGQRVGDRAATGVNCNRANRPVAGFRGVCAESHPFFPLNWNQTAGYSVSSIAGPTLGAASIKPMIVFAS